MDDGNQTTSQEGTWQGDLDEQDVCVMMIQLSYGGCQRD